MSCGTLTMDAAVMIATPRALEIARERQCGWVRMSRSCRRAEWQTSPNSETARSFTGCGRLCAIGVSSGLRGSMTLCWRMSMFNAVGLSWWVRPCASCFKNVFVLIRGCRNSGSQTRCKLSLRGETQRCKVSSTLQLGSNHVIYLSLSNTGRKMSAIGMWTKISYYVQFTKPQLDRRC